MLNSFYKYIAVVSTILLFILAVFIFFSMFTSCTTLSITSLNTEGRSAMKVDDDMNMTPTTTVDTKVNTPDVPVTTTVPAAPVTPAK